jgi:hypothetical protein
MGSVQARIDRDQRQRQQQRTDDGGLFAGVTVDAAIETIHSGNRSSWPSPRLSRASHYDSGYRRFSTYEERINGGSCKSSDGYAQPQRILSDRSIDRKHRYGRAAGYHGEQCGSSNGKPSVYGLGS